MALDEFDQTLWADGALTWFSGIGAGLLRDYKEAFPALGQEMRGVEEKRVDNVIEPVESEQGLLKVTAAVRSEEAGHILEQHQRRPTPSHSIKQVDEPPKRSGLFSRQARA